MIIAQVVVVVVVGIRGLIVIDDDRVRAVDQDQEIVIHAIMIDTVSIRIAVMVVQQHRIHHTLQCMHSHKRMLQCIISKQHCHNLCMHRKQFLVIHHRMVQFIIIIDQLLPLSIIHMVYNRQMHRHQKL